MVGAAGIPHITPALFAPGRRGGCGCFLGRVVFRPLPWPLPQGEGKLVRAVRDLYHVRALLEGWVEPALGCNVQPAA